MPEPIDCLTIANMDFPVIPSIKVLGVSINRDMHRKNSIRARCDNTIRIVKGLIPFLRQLKAPIEVLMKLYHVVIVPSMLYGLKSTSLTQANRRTLMRREIYIIKDLSSLAHPKPANESFYRLLNGKTINRKVSAFRIRYFAHLQRRATGSILHKAMNYKLNLKRKIGRPLFTFNTSVLTDMKKYDAAIDWLWDDKDFIKKTTSTLYERDDADDDLLDQNLMLYESEDEDNEDE